ncbi:hypothetical protein DL96DRAFT_1709986 [Flagelloscypha sp. PMI_526]|nr:hypothetical protein DL96DRAFT_1709986 [Flagelloscypha sp. PMI_526]
MNIPNEIWFAIASYIPDKHLQRLATLSSAFAERAYQIRHARLNIELKQFWDCDNMWEDVQDIRKAIQDARSRAPLALVTHLDILLLRHNPSSKRPRKWIHKHEYLECLIAHADRTQSDATLSQIFDQLPNVKQLTLRFERRKSCNFCLAPTDPRHPITSFVWQYFGPRAVELSLVFWGTHDLTALFPPAGTFKAMGGLPYLESLCYHMTTPAPALEGRSLDQFRIYDIMLDLFCSSPRLHTMNLEGNYGQFLEFLVPNEDLPSKIQCLRFDTKSTGAVHYAHIFARDHAKTLKHIALGGSPDWLKRIGPSLMITRLLHPSIEWPSVELHLDNSPNSSKWEELEDLFSFRHIPSEPPCIHLVTSLALNVLNKEKLFLLLRQLPRLRHLRFIPIEFSIELPVMVVTSCPLLRTLELRLDSGLYEHAGQSMGQEAYIAAVQKDGPVVEDIDALSVLHGITLSDKDGVLSLDHPLRCCLENVLPLSLWSKEEKHGY